MRIGMHDFYRYVLAGAADINLDTIPYEFQAKRRLAIKANIRKKFECITCDSHFSSVLRANLRAINNTALELLLFGNTTDNIHHIYRYVLPETINDTEILALFNVANNRYKFYSTQDMTIMADRFMMFYKTFRLYIDCNEFGTYSNADIALQVYKLIVMFGVNDGFNPFRNIERYIKCHFSGDNLQVAIHDLALYFVPAKSTGLNLPQWQSFIFKHGRKAQHIFQCASLIEKSLGHVPVSLEQAYESYSAQTYKRWQEYPELAHLCATYVLPEYVFDACLALEKERKKSDSLPDIYIDGSEVGHANYYFTKLPVGDPHAYVLGHVTNCCQSIGGASEKCVIDGVKIDNAGFYVLLKKANNAKNLPVDKDGKINHRDFIILGQCFSWLSSSGNLIIDSWENLRPSDDAVVVDFLQEFGKRVTRNNVDIARVTIGLGGKTPNFYRDKAVGNPERINGGLHIYNDSTLQALIYQNDEKVAQKKLSCLAGREKEIVIPMGADDVKLIEQAISSQKQCRLLEQLFLSNEGRDLWHMLLGNDFKTLPDLIRVIKKSGLLILEIISLLHDYKVLTKKIWDFLLLHCIKSDEASLCHFFEDATSFLNELTENNLLKENYLLLAMAAYNSKPERLPNQHLILSEETMAYMYCQLHNNKNVSPINIAMLELYKVKLLSDDSVKLLVDHSQYAWLLAMSIFRLNMAKRLNVDTFNMLIQQPQNAENIVNQLLTPVSLQTGMFAKQNTIGGKKQEDICTLPSP